MYFIFGGECYYASGGGYDLLQKEKDYTKAIEKAKLLIGQNIVIEEDSEGIWLELEIQWTHVMDVSTGEVIKRFGDLPYGQGRKPIRIREGK